MKLLGETSAIAASTFIALNEMYVSGCKNVYIQRSLRVYWCNDSVVNTWFLGLLEGL